MGVGFCFRSPWFTRQPACLLVIDRENCALSVGLRLVTWFFRKCGAYFMRRTFSGDVLYSAIFGEYSKQLLEARTPIEFFIEGTRSRAGE